MSYQDTQLWSQFAVDGEHAKRLAVAYGEFRKNTGQLTSLIQGTLKHLTIHDISHLDGLWSTASLLVGDEFSTNPLELFVFGGAVLLHDSALCAEAYDGLGKVRSTTVWTDTYALCIERGMSDASEIEKLCDFQAIRNLHADQASSLATRAWMTKDSSETVHLISDDVLRNSYGDIIGMIAASHHWSIERLSELLPPQIGAVDDFPSTWSINPVKVACMLRCADAMHISSARAPLFLHALTKRMGVSHDHWQAQNWLTQPTTLSSDATDSTAVFTSTKAFNSENDSAWWVAYELIELVNREISSSNELLNSMHDPNCNSFQIERIAGSGNAKELKKYVRTKGWIPSPIELKVSDIKDLVEKLGGQSLYGANDFASQLLVVIRELAQNALDAINARGCFEPDAAREILISLEEEHDKYLISVADTGCGMTKTVMTGPMLDFGSSFWTSDLVNAEFPKLKGLGFRSAGKYGIGFYSCFMLADSVSVISRNYMHGLEQSNLLKFREGLSLRPQLVEGKNLETMKYSTEVRLSIDKGKCTTGFEFPFGTNFVGSSAFNVTFANAIAHVVQFSGVDVYFEDRDGKVKVVDGDVTKNVMPSDLQIADAHRLGGHVLSADKLKLVESNFRPIDQDNLELGIAALNPYCSNRHGCGAKTIGGLRTNMSSEDGTFFGFIDHSPDSAKRNPHKPTASDDQLRSWCEEQLKLLSTSTLSDVDWHFIGSRLPFFKLDPSPYIRVPVTMGGGLNLLTMEALTDLLLKMPVYIIMETNISTIVEERDADSFELFPRISDIFGIMRMFQSVSHAAKDPTSGESDYSLRILIEAALKLKGKQLEVSSADADKVTIAHRWPMAVLTLKAVD